MADLIADPVQYRAAASRFPSKRWSFEIRKRATVNHEQWNLHGELTGDLGYKFVKINIYDHAQRWVDVPFISEIHDSHPQYRQARLEELPRDTDRWMIAPEPTGGVGGHPNLMGGGIVYITTKSTFSPATGHYTLSE